MFHWGERDGEVGEDFLVYTGRAWWTGDDGRQIQRLLEPVKGVVSIDLA